jgi:hypothetical protein
VLQALAEASRRQLVDVCGLLYQIGPVEGARLEYRDIGTRRCAARQ